MCSEPLLAGPSSEPRGLRQSFDLSSNLPIVSVLFHYK